jgi:hypothetical protein
MEYVHKRNYCQNCGRPSHCHTSYYEDLQNYDEPQTTIKICDRCRCGNCTNIKENNYEF